MKNMRLLPSEEMNRDIKDLYNVITEVLKSRRLAILQRLDGRIG